MQTLINRPWLLDERAVSSVADAHRRFTDGAQLAANKSARSSRQQRGKIAVMSLSGLLMRHPGALLDFVGGTSTAQFGAEFDAAVRDPNVAAVVIVVNSPGGTADGTPELADKIFAARGRKPVIAIADSLAASAAYWIGSAADSLYLVPSGEVGSIGALSIHTSIAEADMKAGIETTVIRAPAFKAEMNMFEKLTNAAREYEQASINKLYGKFLQAVARNRGIGQGIVSQQFGQGRTVDSDVALAVGMVDGVVTTDQLFERLLSDVAGGRRVAMPEHERQARARHEMRLAKQRHEKRQRELRAKGILPGGVPIIRKLHGMVVPWNTPGWTGENWEAVAPEAFDDVLNGSAEVTFTMNHRYQQPIALRSEFQVELSKTAEGLFATVIVPDSPVGRNLMSEINRYGATGWSFSTKEAFDVHEWRQLAGKSTKVLTSGRLFEICVCVAPDKPTYPHGVVLVGAS